MKILGLILVALTMTLSSSAHAQAPGQTEVRRAHLPVPILEQPAPPQTETRNYGVQVFAADVATWLVAGIVLSNSEDDNSDWVLAGLMFNGPIVHIANGNGSGAVLSLLARGGLPFLGAAALVSTCDDGGGDGGFDCLGAMLTGVMLGYGTALVVDWFFLAKKEVAIQPAGWASVRPSISVQDDGLRAGLAFAF